MEQMMQYLVSLTQSNAALTIALIIGIFVALICIAAVDRRLKDMNKELDALIKFHAIEIPEEKPEVKQKKRKKASSSDDSGDNAK